MRKLYYFMSLFSFGMIAGSPQFLHSQTATMNPPKSASDQQNGAQGQLDAVKQNDLKDPQKQQAEWMVESLQAAKEYVDALDQGGYASSWSNGDTLFQHTISKDEWIKALNMTRKPQGRLQSRTLRDQRIAWNPHGLPAGAYMVVEFNTAFENAPASGELLTLRRGADGKWRILTYQSASLK